MRLLFLAVLLSIVVIGSVSIAYAISDEDRVAKLQKGIDKIMDRVQVLEDKRDKIDKRINTLLDKAERKQANINRINGVPLEPFVKTDKMNYSVGETIHVTGMKLTSRVIEDVDHGEEIELWEVNNELYTLRVDMISGGNMFFECYSNHFDEAPCDEIPELIQNDDGTFSLDILIPEDCRPGLYYVMQISQVTLESGGKSNAVQVSHPYFVIQ